LSLLVSTIRTEQGSRVDAGRGMLHWLKLAGVRMWQYSHGLEKAHPEAAFIVVGDFNRDNMRKVLPKYHQHINLPTCGDHTLDHCYSQLRNSYKPLPRSALVRQITSPYSSSQPTDD